jgi:ribonuclease D
MTEISARVHHIQSDESLKKASKAWQGSKLVVLDTEFIRVNTYYPIAGLIQVGCGDDCFLIDPLAVDDWSPLADLFRDTSILKVLHACSEDLELFKILVNVLPRPLFDSQLAAALNGQGFSLSYQSLVESMLGVSIAKGETRSNWLQRPLTASQSHYAVLDVEYLEEISTRQIAMLDDKGRGSWLQEECERLLFTAGNQTAPEEYYLKLPGAWRLDRAGLMVLKTLCAWREREAEHSDLPRNRIVTGKSLLLVAKQRLDTKDDLKIVADLTPKQIRKYADEILLLSNEARQVSKDQYPEALQKPLARDMAPWMKKMQQLVREVADELQIAPEILARKKQLEALLASGRETGEYKLPESLLGWRKPVIGDQLMAIATAERPDQVL